MLVTPPLLLLLFPFAWCSTPLLVALLAVVLSTSAEFLAVESESDVGRLCEWDGEFECVDEGSTVFEDEIPAEEEEEDG